MTNSAYVEDEAPISNSEDTENVYQKAQPDTIDETMDLVKSDFNSLVNENESDKAMLQNRAYEGQSDSSGIHSDKGSDCDSKNSTCDSSGIGQEPPVSNKTPLGTGLFALLTHSDLEDNDDDDCKNGVYQQIDVTRKPSCQFDDFPTQDEEKSTLNSSAVPSKNNDISHQTESQSGPESQFPGPETVSYSEQCDSVWIESDEKEHLSEIEQQLNMCASCHKRHEPNIKCGLPSPELRSHQRDRQKRIDSNCSDVSIPLGVLNGTSDFSIDISPSINSKLQLSPQLLTSSSNATSC